MEIDLTRLDWALIEVFLAVYETGSLTAAAEKMGSSQPTLGRQIRQLEKWFSQPIFIRHAKGFEPTQLAVMIYKPACEMRTAMSSISAYAAETQVQMSGTVRITSSAIVGHFILPELLAEIAREYPKIELEMQVSDKTESLTYGEADIAIRMYRPEKGELVVKKLGDMEIVACASKDYLARKGRPTTVADLGNHNLVGYDRNDIIVRNMRDYGVPINRRDFSVRCDDQPAVVHLVQAGCGIGFSPRIVQTKQKNVEPLFPDLTLPSLPVFMVSSHVLKLDSRIKTIWDALATKLTNILANQ